MIIIFLLFVIQTNNNHNIYFPPQRNGSFFCCAENVFCDFSAFMIFMDTVCLKKRTDRKNQGAYLLHHTVLP